MISPQVSRKKLTSERLQEDEAATMLFPSHRKAVRVQSNDAQTRLDRQLYASTAANPSRAQGGGQASMQRKLTSERLQGDEAATMLFPSQRKAVRVQSNDAQTRLDRQLYASTAANPSFEFCMAHINDNCFNETFAVSPCRNLC